ncbi:MAG: S24 family peptidase [Ruminococcus sp.]|nr:MAG: S24 family peptidase [Ruminococcus sp.]
MLDTDEWDTIDVPDSPEARKADFCLTIHGNSMEPVYYNGDIVLVKEQQSVEKGQIGIFIIEGCGYIKKFGGDRLISLNEEYDDIMFSEYNPDDIRCSGLVIGRV